jgi:hypothetical protein
MGNRGRVKHCPPGDQSKNVVGDLHLFGGIKGIKSCSDGAEGPVKRNTMSKRIMFCDRINSRFRRIGVNY